MWHRQFLGLLSYEEGLQQQELAAEAVRLNPGQGFFLVLEHHPVITLGRRAGEADLLSGIDQLAAEGIQVQKVSRGGLATAHEPGQLVVYPIVSLASLRLSPSVFMEKMVDSIVCVLRDLGVDVWAKPEHRGVFCEKGKIASVGTSVRENITSHGLSVNVHNDLATFSRIIPCGLEVGVMTSLKTLGYEIDALSLGRQICDELEKNFPFFAE